MTGTKAEIKEFLIRGDLANLSCKERPLTLEYFYRRYAESDDKRTEFKKQIVKVIKQIKKGRTYLDKFKVCGNAKEGYYWYVIEETGNKEEISKVFLELKKYGFKVFSFGDKRALRRGAKGFVDAVIIEPNLGVLFIEVKTKLTNDKYRGEQEELADIINDIAVATLWVRHEVITTLKEAIDLREQLINNRS